MWECTQFFIQAAVETAQVSFICLHYFIAIIQCKPLLKLDQVIELHFVCRAWKIQFCSLCNTQHTDKVALGAFTQSCFWIYLIE